MADDDKKKKKKKQKSIEKSEEALEKIRITLEAEKTLSGILEANNELRAESISLHQAIIAKTIKEYQEAAKLGPVRKEIHDNLIKQIADQKKYIKQLKEEAVALDSISSISSNIFQSLTGVTGTTNTLIGSFLRLKDAGGSLDEGLGAMTAKLGGAKMSTLLLDSALGKVQEATITLAMAQDAALASFNRTTGAMGKYNKMIINMESNNRLFGVSTEDAASATGALYSQMNNFTQLNRAEQQQLATTVAVLEKFGISADTTAKNMTIASRALGMNVSETERLQRELFATAEALKLPPQTVADGFSQAAPVLAKHGKNMVSVFKGLATQSKKTGLAMDELLGIADKFDTFAGAAEAAGTLNTILGGDLLNSMDLLMATEEERIKMLQDSVAATGRSWNSLNRWEKKAIASAAGISDMNKAAMLFNPTMAGMTEEQKRSATAMKSFEKNIKEVRPLLDELKSLGAEFAVEIRPAIVALKDFVHWILELNKSFKKFMKEHMPWEEAGNTGFLPWVIGGTAGLAIIGKILPGLKAIGGGFMGLFGVLGKFSKGTKAAGGVMEGISKFTHGPKSPTKGLTEMGKGMDNAGKAAASSWKSILAFGGAVLLIGAGIWLAANGMSQFVAAFNGMSPEQINAVTNAILAFGAIMLGLITALVLVSIFAATASGPMLLFGSAVLLIGIGIGIAAAGMSLFVDAIANAFVIISGNMDAFTAFVGGLMMLSVLSVPLAATFGALTLGLGAMALALKFISTEDLSALGNLFMGISNITSDTVSSLQAVGAEIKNIGEQLNNIDKEVLVSFGTLVNPPDVGISTEQVVSRIRAVSAVISGAPAGAQAPTNIPADNRPVENTFNITLEMDGNVLDKRIIKVVKGKIKGDTP